MKKIIVWPYEVSIKRSPKLTRVEISDMEHWLFKNMGKMYGRWMIPCYYLTWATYYFKEESDAVMFKLKWS